MKIKALLFCFTAYFSVSSLYSQTETPNLLTDLNSVKSGEGHVKILQDETISKSLGSYMPNDSSAHPKLSNETTNGFKVQVFVGNDQNTSRVEAEERQRMISQAFPDQQALVSYNSPFYKVKVGNFLDRYQAEQFMEELKKAFPSFAKEMYIVSDKIRKPLR